MSLKGKVKWFNGKKGYGFIEREDKEKDVFVHHTAVRDAGLKYLNEGDELTFEWWPGTESNRRHKPFQGSALPTELPGLFKTYKLFYP